MRQVVSQVPGLRRDGDGRFYYPRQGFGQISEAYADAARSHGAAFLLGWTVKRLEQPQTPRQAWRVMAERDGTHRTLEADYVWSTLPLSLLARLLAPTAPAAVLDAAGALSYRAMLLIYLQLDMAQFTPYDAHYFPASTIAITRLSEPSNYAAATQPHQRTTLCAELPCMPDEAYWHMSDAMLAQRVADDLAQAGLPLPTPPVAVQVKRLRQAYPIYAQGYEPHFEALDTWVDSLPQLLSYGRQGLFAHDNTHHALAMAYAAATCLQTGAFDAARWQAYRRVFETHVVED
jgi:protoporphyrinogen oxidase